MTDFQGAVPKTLQIKNLLKLMNGNGNHTQDRFYVASYGRKIEIVAKVRLQAVGKNPVKPDGNEGAPRSYHISIAAILHDCAMRKSVIFSQTLCSPYQIFRYGECEGDFAVVVRRVVSNVRCH